MVLKAILKPIGVRLGRLRHTLSCEYKRVGDLIEDEDFSLQPDHVLLRCSAWASWFTGLTAALSFPLLLVYRGLSTIWTVPHIIPFFMAAWCGFFCLFVVAHVIWISTISLGTTLGGSNLFTNFVSNRWAPEIDKIAEEFMTKNSILSMEINRAKAPQDSELSD